MLAAAWEGLVFSVSSTPAARSPLAVMNRPRGRRSSSRHHSGAPLMTCFSSTSFRLRKTPMTLLSAAPLAVRVSGKGKERSVVAFERRAEDHKLSVTKFCCCRWVLDMTTSIVAHRPIAGASIAQNPAWRPCEG